MRLARFLLVLFFILIFLHLSRRLFISYFDRDPSYYFGLAAMAVLALAVWAYTSVLPPVGRVGFFHGKLLFFLLALVALFAYGYLARNSVRFMLLDLAPYLIVLAFLILGRYDQVWRDLEIPAVLLFWAGLAVVAVGLSRPNVELSYGGIIMASAVVAVERSSVATLGYDLAPLLGLAPLLFALAFLRPRWGLLKLLGVAGMVACLGLQVYFQKRAPTARLLAYVAMATVIIPFLSKRLRMGTALLLIGGLAALYVLIGQERIGLLRQRYEMRDVSRFEEAQAMLAELSMREYVFGRGLGGYFTPPPGWEAGTEPVGRRGEMGNASLHIGMLVPFLKGGVLFCLIYYAFFLPAVYRKRPGWHQNVYNSAAMLVLPVYWVFLGVEGAPTMANPLDAVLAGLVCARFAVPVAQPAEEPQLLTAEEYAWMQYEASPR